MGKIVSIVKKKNNFRKKEKMNGGRVCVRKTVGKGKRELKNLECSVNYNGRGGREGEEGISKSFK